jgi:hypothetical protein
MKMGFLQSFFVILLIVMIIAIFPKAANPCAHTYCVGYWFEPCGTYAWRCESCGMCKTTCLYYAVVITCRDKDGNRYYLDKCHAYLCGPSPD